MTQYTTRKVNGAAVRALRKALGIKQIELAIKAQVTNGTLSRIESGSRQPSPTVIRKLASCLEVPAEAITYPVEVQVKEVAWK